MRNVEYAIHVSGSSVDNMAINFCMSFAFVSFLLMGWVNALSWQDCGLQSEIPALRLKAYQHAPDPIVYNSSSIITKQWKYTGDGYMKTFTETVVVARRSENHAPWEIYFNNSFDICAYHDGICGSVHSGGEFTYYDNHPPSVSLFYPYFRAIEHYYVNGIFSGCATIVYDQMRK
jgi:hypothetical protein